MVDVRRDAMSLLVIRDTSRIRFGRLESVRAAFGELARFVVTNEPRVILYTVLLSPDDSTATVLQIHPDAASAETHIDVAAAEFEQFADLLDLDDIEVYGEPNSELLARLQRKADLLGGTGVVVHEALAGFARCSEPLP